VKIVRHPDEMKNLSLSFQRSGAKVGLVPTMGALHEGHLSLLDKAREVSDIGVMSIFVNPSQFGPDEDLARYPRPFDSDCEKAAARGCDIVFAPQPAGMYPPHYATHVEVADLSARLCGVSRPGHFRGVATVVLKLFNIVMPQTAVFGQKDAQQAIILKRMVCDLNMSVNMIIAPIVRESDGLAMSSRNAYLSAEERREVPLIYAALHEAEEAFAAGERSAQKLQDMVVRRYDSAKLFHPEYVEVVDTLVLNPVDLIDRPVLLAVACRTVQSNTRLIDNVILGGCL